MTDDLDHFLGVNNMVNKDVEKRESRSPDGDGLSRGDAGATPAPKEPLRDSLDSQSPLTTKQTTDRDGRTTPPAQRAGSEPADSLRLTKEALGRLQRERDFEKNANAATQQSLRNYEENISRLSAEIDSAWFGIEHGYDVEPRAFFEHQPHGPGQVFASPLQQAIHHIWKREPKVQELEATVARLRHLAHQLEGYAKHAFTCELTRFGTDVQITVRQHVCGLMGYNPTIDPECPGCADSRNHNYRAPHCTCGLAALTEPHA